jgi:hypothetical protein
MTDTKQPKPSPEQAGSQVGAGTQKNEGEGNKTAARQYNKEQREFVKSGRVDQAASEAAEAVSGSEKDDLKRAEETGRSKAKE